MGRMLRACAAAVALIFAVPAMAGGYYGTAPVSAASLGFSSPKNLSTTPTTSAFQMDGDGGYFTRLSLVMTVVWGTSVIMNVRLKYSYDGVAYGFVERCTSAATHICAPRVWQYKVADGTVPTLDYETNYPFMIAEFDDPADGTGTVSPIVIRGR